jgi:hypothetical protein
VGYQAACNYPFLERFLEAFQETVRLFYIEPVFPGVCTVFGIL